MILQEEGFDFGEELYDFVIAFPDFSEVKSVYLNVLQLEQFLYLIQRIYYPHVCSSLAI